MGGGDYTGTASWGNATCILPPLKRNSLAVCSEVLTEAVSPKVSLSCARMPRRHAVAKNTSNMRTLLTIKTISKPKIRAAKGGGLDEKSGEVVDQSSK